MPMLEHEGVFTMHLPEGWTASRTASTYELLPATGDGAIHISVYDRRPGPLSEDETRSVVARFVANIGPSEPAEIRVLAERPAQHRAVVHCSAYDPDSGTTMDWLVFAVMWPSSMLMCSATAPAGDPIVADAELLLAAISPVARSRRRLFRR